MQARILALRTELTAEGLDAGVETIAAHLAEGLASPYPGRGGLVSVILWRCTLNPVMLTL